MQKKKRPSRHRLQAAQRSHITAMDVLTAAPDAPIPRHIRDNSLIQVLAAQQCILRGQAITHQWRAVVDAVNVMETLRRAGHIQDEGGYIFAAVEGILRAIERQKASGSDHALLDGPGITAVREVLAAFPTVLDSLTHRQYVQTLRETDLRLREASLRRNPQLRAEKP